MCWYSATLRFYRHGFQTIPLLHYATILQMFRHEELYSVMSVFSWLGLTFLLQRVNKKALSLRLAIEQQQLPDNISVEPWECTTKTMILNLHPEMHNACAPGPSRAYWYMELKVKICLCIILNGDITEHQGYCSQTTNMTFFSKNCILTLWVKAERGE